VLEDLEKKSVDVDQLMVKWEEALALRRARSKLDPVKYFVKKRLIDPVIFVVVSLCILLLPQSVLSFLSKGKLMRFVQRFIIRTVDITIASVGLLISAPLFLVLPILIKLNSPGPVFYKQLRTGINRRKTERRGVKIGDGEERRNGERRKHDLFGKPFHIYKFRTMKEQAEQDSGAVWATSNDSRITSVGIWLRKYHVDEIPQFINVLRGEMSMVGPRPERPEIIYILLEKMPAYSHRFTTKPGATGPAQIFLGYDSCMADIKRKIQFDSIYIEHQNLRLYFLILVLTVVKIFSSLLLSQIQFFNLNKTFNEHVKSEPEKQIDEQATIENEQFVQNGKGPESKRVPTEKTNDADKNNINEEIQSEQNDQNSRSH
jgi:lipopolysaccharide/colanic/teichoic acid biosynthesis glycosyltransferase